jgi:hypothetical protein
LALGALPVEVCLARCSWEGERGEILDLKTVSTLSQGPTLLAKTKTCLQTDTLSELLLAGRPSSWQPLKWAGTLCFVCRQPDNWGTFLHYKAQAAAAG